MRKIVAPCILPKATTPSQTVQKHTICREPVIVGRRTSIEPVAERLPHSSVPLLPSSHIDTALELSTLPSVPIVVKSAPRSNAGRKPSVRPGINDRAKNTPSTVSNQVACVDCGALLIDILHDSRRGDVVCTKCGFVDSSQILVEPEYKQQPPRSCSSKRRIKFHRGILRRVPKKQSVGQKYNHMSNFNEILTQLQGLENITCIRPPVTLDSILDSMRAYFCSKNIAFSDVTPANVHSYLKAHDITSLYKHIVKLAHMVNQRPTPRLTADQSSRLTARFQQYLVAWATIKKQSRIGLRDESRHFCTSISRKNVMAYRFVIFKLCELENIPDICRVSFLPRIPRKVACLDLVWRHICNHTGFEYIPTSHIHAHYK
jgi:hypothetical protein